MSKWEQTSFYKDGRKEIHCRNCGRYLMESRLTDNKAKSITCKECGTINSVFPPRKVTVDGKKFIAFGDAAPGRNPLECTVTADLTGTHS